MPSPIAHVAVGYLIYRGCFRQFTSPEARSTRQPLGPLLVAFGLSMLPDLDAVVGTVAGDLGRYHNNVTHSFILGLGAALSLGGLAVLGRRLGPCPLGKGRISTQVWQGFFVEPGFLRGPHRYGLDDLR